MKKNLKALAILFSVVLNIAFLTFAAYSRWSFANAPSSPSVEGPLLYEQLNLTEEQLKRFEPLRDRFHTQIRRIRSEIEANQLDLIDFLAAPSPDPQVIRAQQEKIRELQRTMQDTVVNHILEESKVFTPEQRIKFFQLLKERSRADGRSCPPLMKPFKRTGAGEKQG